MAEQSPTLTSAAATQRPIDRLITFLKLYLEQGPHPVLWVGAGASAAAGYPTMGRLEALLRSHLPGCTASSFELADAFVEEFGEATLANLLQNELGQPRPFVELHRSIVRLAQASAAGSREPAAAGPRCSGSPARVWCW